MKLHHKLFFSALFILSIAALVFVFAFGENRLANSDANLAATKSENGTVAGANTAQDSYLAKLAKALSDKGAVLYCASTSEDCKSQLALFGSSSEAIDYVECDPTGESPNVDECHAQAIEVYPTWIYQGNRNTGVQELSTLASMIGFGQ